MPTIKPACAASSMMRGEEIIIAKPASWSRGCARSPKPAARRDHGPDKFRTPWADQIREMLEDGG